MRRFENLLTKWFLFYWGTCLSLAGSSCASGEVRNDGASSGGNNGEDGGPSGGGSLGQTSGGARATPSGGSDSGGTAAEGGGRSGITTGGGGGSDVGGSPSSSGGAPPSSGGTVSTGGGEPSGGTSALDEFGITHLYPSDPSGGKWTSQHYTEDYEVAFGTDDRDPSALSGARGTGTLRALPSGELVMSGSAPRLYINPDPTHEWRNLEITVYYQRVEDSGAAYAGLVVGARSGPDGHTSDGACDAHTYYARLRNDGAFDFEKELKHPASSTKSRVAPEVAWPSGGMVPRETWLGWKFVIYNLDDQTVKLEAYLDLTEGAGGGDWQLVNETTDEGGWFVETDCAEHAPEGGESDLVVTGGGSILVRNTDVTEARYRAMSVREITAP
jgi:hypothetical protein